MQILFNIIVGIAAFFGGWILNTIWKSIQDLQQTDHKIAEEVADMRVLVAGQYMTRSEMNEMSKAIFEKLDKIYDKLDGKADK
jgi:hypothetical protein